MDSRPPIIDLHAELAKLSMFRGRTPQSTMEDRTGVERLQRCTAWPLRSGRSGDTLKCSREEALIIAFDRRD